MKQSRCLLIAILCLVGQFLGAAPVQTVEIDSKAVATSINPFVYGQFIEHLGRCIYGGIWAEMLEDRKFYFAITPEYAPYKDLKDTEYPVVGASPWEIVGQKTGVTMEQTDVFVGTHTPSIKAGAGIRQNDLGVVSGRGYTGYLWAHSTGKKSKIEVALVTGPKPSDRVKVAMEIPGGAYVRHAFSFTAPATTNHASLEILVSEDGVRLGTVSLMPSDNVRGMRRDTLALLKELNSPIYRWPGGNFTSGYDWHDGVGDRDRRPPRGNPAWTGVEHNDFGTDEFLDFCREIGTTPIIAANTGFGDAYSAAQWVEYCNGSVKTLAGGWRKANGHAEPYAVKYWCVGNEMFGPWQLGFMQLQQYTIKHNTVATAMKVVDPSLVLVGVGAIDQMNKEYDPDQVKRGVMWSEGMLQACSDKMDLISEHVYDGRLPWKPEIGRAALTDHVGLLRTAIRHVADRHREMQAKVPALHGKMMPVSLDEWNYWHREYVFGELGCRYDLADGLGVAVGLHEILRQSDLIQAAFYAQTVNVIGAIKTSRTAAELETTGLVLAMYRAHFGQTLFKLKLEDSPVDVIAARTKDGKSLTLAVVNATKEAIKLPVKFDHSNLSGKATVWSVGGADEHLFNNPGSARTVDIVKTEGIDASQPLDVPAMTCSLFVIPLP